LIHFYKRVSGRSDAVMSISSMVATSWPWLVGGTLSSLLAYANLPSAWILPALPATEQFLAAAKLQPLPGSGLVNPRDIWQKTGAVVMAVRRPG